MKSPHYALSSLLAALIVLVTALGSVGSPRTALSATRSPACSAGCRRPSKPMKTHFIHFELDAANETSEADEEAFFADDARTVAPYSDSCGFDPTTGTVYEAEETESTGGEQTSFDEVRYWEVGYHSWRRHFFGIIDVEVGAEEQRAMVRNGLHRLESAALAAASYVKYLAADLRIETPSFTAADESAFFEIPAVSDADEMFVWYEGFAAPPLPHWLDAYAFRDEVVEWDRDAIEGDYATAEREAAIDALVEEFAITDLNGSPIAPLPEPNRVAYEAEYEADYGHAPNLADDEEVEEFKLWHTIPSRPSWLIRSIRAVREVLSPAVDPTPDVERFLQNWDALLDRADAAAVRQARVNRLFANDATLVYLDDEQNAATASLSHSMRVLGEQAADGLRTLGDWMHFAARGLETTIIDGASRQAQHREGVTR